jgi:hypothetical protein
MWNKAQQLLKEPYFRKEQWIFWGKKENNNRLIPSRKKVEQYFKAFQSSKKFDELKQKLNLIQVRIGSGIDNLSCTCSRYLLYGCCAHILAALVDSKKITIPEEYDQTVIVFMKKKKGRPKKNKNVALKKDK